jgi:lipoprotein signal peptidase
MQQEIDEFRNLKDERMIKRSFVFWLCGFLILLGIDQLSKWIAFSYNGILPFWLLDSLRLFKNDRFAFSLPIPVALMYVIYAAALIGIYKHLRTQYGSISTQEVFAWLFILAGGMGLILGRKAFQKSFEEGIKILEAVQEVYRCEEITVV